MILKQSNTLNGYCMYNSVKELLDICENRVESVAKLIEKIL